MSEFADKQRIKPLDYDAATDFQKQILNSFQPSHLKIFRTFIHNPGLFRPWLAFAGKLTFGGKLPARTRELCILRTAWLCEGEYEWCEHVPKAREAGLNKAEIRVVRDGAEHLSWSVDDANLLRTVDELVIDHRIKEDTWDRLAAHHTEVQLIELTMLVGHYAMVAGALNSFGVTREEQSHGLGEVD